MEDTDNSTLEEMLTCPVCQDIFQDPRQLPCGHSICMGCLEGMVDHATLIPFRCPDCRGYFGRVVGVQKSYTLSSIAEDFKVNRKRKDQQIKTVYCDLCPEKKTLAKKTCLKCEVSMCEEHVKDHQELQVFTGHPLVKPLSDLLERKCPQHEDQVLKYYCKTSRRYICNLCALENKQLNQATETSTVLRRQLTEYMDQHFNALDEQIKESNKMVKKLQRDIDQEKQKVNPANSPINSVIVVLLFLWFIVLYYAYSYSTENQALTEALAVQQNRVHHLYSSIAEVLVDQPVKSHNHQEALPGTLSLDRDSASPYLGLSTDLRTAERLKTKLNYPDKPRRFAEAPQVLSARCFSIGSHVWEVEAEGYWDIAVSYKSIKRKSKNSSTFGKNTESWSLTHNGKGNLFAYHDGVKTVLSETLQSSRIAVSVDIEKGNITFSALDSTIKHLHEFKAELTEPVCLGFGLYRVDPLSKATIISVW
ncbi:nuclear factor 7%2C ovary-like isoform X2 [Xyrichtys novacula]|uniref:Nuclear factor 7, ovary-like isoform X2 n=1 Tax=Xyrichtys novacula TaxID=13765 RepID=A0AAV1GEI3_XYRNO|nr:nuclear factor 7%2C ovary-like isoform X2 [Xyrichtys novacula]